MAQARSPKFVQKPPPVVVEPKQFQLLLLKQANRREGSLAAALVQSMALAVISTAGAYPSWVLVTSSGRQVVLGASWAINQADPPRGSPLLGPTGGPLMLAIAFCCLCSVVSGSLAIGWDFLGQRQYRALGPVLHCLTALLITCAAALGSSLLGVVRGRARAVPELRPLGFAAAPGQSLFLSFLACALAATATGLSCSSPALVAPARSSRDSRFVGSLDFESSDEEPSGGASWFHFLRPDQAPGPPKERLWRRPQPRSAVAAAEGEEESAADPRGQPERSPPSPVWPVLSLPKFMEGVMQTWSPGAKEPKQEEPGHSARQAAEAGVEESQAEGKEGFPAAV